MILKKILFVLLCLYTILRITMNGALPAEVLEDLAQQFGKVNATHDYGESQLSKMQDKC